MKRQLESKTNRMVILLAAGFSVNRGYPSGGTIDERIKDLKDSDFDFRGVNLQNVYLFLLDIIKYYSSNIEEKDFKYEDLYDGIDLTIDVERKFDVMSEEYGKLSLPYRTDFFTHKQLVCHLPIVLNSIIMSLISDDGNLDIIENVKDNPAIFQQYKNFVKFLKNESERNLIEIFTLNHDLFIDRFKDIPDLKDKICDGFDDINSLYYGLKFYNGGETLCQLERYTARYYKPIRIYKLHGSFDYFPFYKKIETGGIPFAVAHNFVKLKTGIHPFYLSKMNNRTMKYEESLSPSPNPDFLSGTEIKKVKYNNPYLYSRLFKKFKKKLLLAHQVIIIGYGAKDMGINNYLYDNIRKIRVTIFNYSPDEYVYNLQKKLDANLIKGDFNDMINKIE